MSNNHADSRNKAQGNADGTYGDDKHNQNQQSGSPGNPAGQTTQGGDGVQKQRGEGDKQDRLKGVRIGSQQGDSEQSDGAGNQQSDSQGSRGKSERDA